MSFERPIFEYAKRQEDMCRANDQIPADAYQMLGIPKELFTPIFSIARIAGWSAHRLEELVSGGKIIRPAYPSLMQKKELPEEI